MAYQPTFPSPYMETIDATQEGGNIFKCLINPKDTILDASINIFNNDVVSRKLIYTGDNKTLSGSTPRIINPINTVDKNLCFELEQRMRRGEILSVKIVTAGGEIHTKTINKIIPNINNSPMHIYLSSSIETSANSYQWFIYSNVTDSIVLPKTMFPFRGGLSDNSWLICNMANSTFNNGEDYKWSINLKVDENKAISQSLTAITPPNWNAIGTLDFTKHICLACSQEMLGACLYALNQDSCTITINSETRKIIKIHDTCQNFTIDNESFINVKCFEIDTPLSKPYSHKDICTVLQSFSEITSPEYYFKARTNPVVTFDIPEIISNSSYIFNATYSQEQKVGVAYFQYDLYSKSEFIASSGKVFTQNISHTFENLVNGTEYVVKLTIVNNDGVEIYEERTFNVDYPIMVTTINPIISVDNDKTCISVDFSNNASIPSTLIGTDKVNYKTFGDPNYVVVSSGSVIAYTPFHSSSTITIEPYDNIMSNMYIKIGEEIIRIANYILQDNETIIATLDGVFSTAPLLGSSYEICSYYNGVHLEEGQAILWDTVSGKPLVIPDRGSQVIHWHGSHGFKGLILEKINSEFMLGSTTVSYDGENFTYKLGTTDVVSYCPYVGTANAIAGRDEHSVVGRVQAYDSSSSSIILEYSEFIIVGRSVQVGSEYRIITDVFVDGEAAVAILDRAFDIEPTPDDIYAVYDDNYMYVLNNSDELADTDILIDNDLSYKYWWLIVLLPEEVKFIKTVPVLGKNVTIEGNTKGEIIYYNNTSLSEARYMPSSTTVGNYALFAGGSGYEAPYVYNFLFFSTVDAYDSLLTRTLATPLSEAKYGMGATTVGNYALFAGGIISGINQDSLLRSSVIDAYNSSLTKASVIDCGVASTPAATTVGDYALFGGGTTETGVSDTVYAYDKSLTKHNVSSLSAAIKANDATTVGDYALFGGGMLENNYESGAVNGYDSSLTKISVSPLSDARSSYATTTVGNYALFAGGINYKTWEYFSTVDGYDTSLTRISITNLSIARDQLSATTVGNYALFGGGTNDEGNYSIIDMYDSSLTRTLATPLSEAKYGMGATTMGNYALFGGGTAGLDRISTVEVYELTYKEETK